MFRESLKKKMNTDKSDAKAVVAAVSSRELFLPLPMPLIKNLMFFVDLQTVVFLSLCSKELNSYFKSSIDVTYTLSEIKESSLPDCSVSSENPFRRSVPLTNKRSAIFDCNGKTIKISNAQDPSRRLELEGHSKTIQNVFQVKPDEVISLSLDNTIKQWNIETGECLQTIPYYSGSFRWKGYNADPRKVLNIEHGLLLKARWLLVSDSPSRDIKKRWSIYDLAEAKKVREFDLHICHAQFLFTDRPIEENRLVISYYKEDQGRYEVDVFSVLEDKRHLSVPFVTLAKITSFLLLPKGGLAGYSNKVGVYFWDIRNRTLKGIVHDKDCFRNNDDYLASPVDEEGLFLMGSKRIMRIGKDATALIDIEKQEAIAWYANVNGNPYLTTLVLGSDILTYSVSSTNYANNFSITGIDLALREKETGNIKQTFTVSANKKPEFVGVSSNGSALFRIYNQVKVPGRRAMEEIEILYAITPAFKKREKKASEENVSGVSSSLANFNAHAARSFHSFT